MRGAMRHLVLASLSAAVASAFAPAPLRWGGSSARSFILAPAPKTSLNRVSPQPLTIVEPFARNSPYAIPLFTVTSAGAIVTESIATRKMCLEASGSKDGDLVHLSYCTSGPMQRWKWQPLYNEHQYQIQLLGTRKCLTVAGKDGVLSGSSAELQHCEDTARESWKFEEQFPMPTEEPSQSPKSSYYAMISLISIAMLGVLSLPVWILRRQKRKQPALARSVVAPLNLHSGGACGIVSGAARLPTRAGNLSNVIMKSGSASAASEDDPYVVLGVPRSATAAQIKQAYRRVAMRTHPDVSKAADAQATFQKVVWAYAVLSDSDQRAKYDRKSKSSNTSSSSHSTSNTASSASYSSSWSRSDPWRMWEIEEEMERLKKRRDEGNPQANYNRQSSSQASSAKQREPPRQSGRWSSSKNDPWSLWEIEEELEQMKRARKSASS